MFGSQILEVGIGLILIFLLVSLILTAVRETIEGWQKTRSRDLEHALAELLDDHAGTGARKELYDHPLINSLFRGAPQPTEFSNRKAVGRVVGNLPSYIPRETFALALEDLLRDGKAGGRAAEVYQALSRATGGDIDRTRKGLEQWYDATMDRAAGWYKRRTQKILFVLGVGIALLLNINAMAIGQYLATSDVARQRVSAIAERLSNDPEAAAALARRDAVETGDAEPPTGNEVAPANQAAAANGTAPAPDPANEIMADGAEADANESGTANAAAESNAVANESEAAANTAAESNELANESAGASETGDTDPIARELARELRNVELPMGWGLAQRERMAREYNGAPFAAFLSWLLGYLIVGFAATLGAPFWFDLLGKFMVIRSTVKPTEKSPDEASKDGGTGGAPQRAADSDPAPGNRPPPRGPGFTSPLPDRATDSPDPVLFG